MVRRSPARVRESDGELDDVAPDYLGTLLQSLVPRTLAHRTMAVSVTTDRDTYDIGDPVEVTITLTNRLPVPVEIVTTTQRLWGWAVEGHISAREEPLHLSGNPRAFTFGARERRTFTRTWHGSIKRDVSPRRWEAVDPGRYRISAFVELTNRRISDETIIHLR